MHRGVYEAVWGCEIAGRGLSGRPAQAAAHATSTNGGKARQLWAGSRWSKRRRLALLCH